jgi:hypothetical protein
MNGNWEDNEAGSAFWAARRGACNKNSHRRRQTKHFRPPATLTTRFKSSGDIYGFRPPQPFEPTKHPQIRGNFTGTFAELLDLVRRRALTPVVTGSYRLEEANEVLAKLERREIIGRAVLIP